MYFEEEFKTHLQADPAIAGLVSDRVFPDVIPQAGNIPAIVYTVVDGKPGNSLDGFTSGRVRYMVQVDCWARSYQTCLALARLIRDRLNLRTATLSTYTTSYPGVTEFEPDTKRYRRMLEVSCSHCET